MSGEEGSGLSGQRGRGGERGGEGEVRGESEREREREGGEEVKCREGWARWKTAHPGVSKAPQHPDETADGEKSSVSSLLKVSPVFVWTLDGSAMRRRAVKWTFSASFHAQGAHSFGGLTFPKRRAPSCRWDFMLLRGISARCFFFSSPSSPREKVWLEQEWSRKTEAEESRGELSGHNSLGTRRGDTWVSWSHVLMGKQRCSNVCRPVSWREMQE